MKKFALSIATIAALVGGALLAQDRDISGTWQGTLKAPNRDLRIVMKVSKTSRGALQAMMYSIDQPGPGIPAGSITVQGSSVKIAVPGIGGTYEGKLSNADGTVMAGTWTQGPTPIAMEMTLATEKTAWAIPDAPPPPVPMATDAAPSFEVATIKPSVPDAQGKGIRMNGRNFSTLNTSVNDLITFAYELHPRQISGGPAWMDSDKFDLAAIPDKPGAPSDKQIKGMMQKLLAERFKLTFHHDKRELTVFVVTVAKSGSKLTKSTGNADGLPSLGFRGLGNFNGRNANMSDFAQVMQRNVLDRPVVDQTELRGRFDFTLLWTPDETQFGGRGGQAPPPPDGGTAPPSLFTAVQEQLGLKMDPAKAPVDVLVIDRVEKPSEN